MRVHSTHPPYLIELSASELAEIELALEEHRRVSWLRAKELTDALGAGLHVPGPEVFVREIDDVLEQIELLDPSGAAGWVEGELLDCDLVDCNLFDELDATGFELGPDAGRCACGLLGWDPRSCDPRDCELCDCALCDCELCDCALCDEDRRRSRRIRE